MSSQIMRAIRVSQFGGPEVLKLLSDVAVPSPGKGQILIKLSAASVNPVETYKRSGNYARLPTLPSTPGNNGAGTVHSVGDGVMKFKTGDRVYTLQSVTGTYAEYTVCDEDSIYHLPSALTFSQGVAVGSYFTAYRALFHRLHAMPSETVLVHGASGGVGTAAVQLARAHGMQVFGTAGSSEGEKLVRDAGAHYVFNHRTPGYTQAIMDATDGKGVDVIVEMLANVNLDKDLELVAPGGRIGVVGNRGTIEINPRATMAKECSIIGVMMPKATKVQQQEAAAALHAGMEGGWLKPVVGKEYPLVDAAAAQRDIIESKGALGKLVLLMQ